MDFLRNVMGGQQASGNVTGKETVEKLVDRIKTSTLLTDRRDAVRAVKALSKKYRTEVGSLALPSLLNILHNDRSDNEIVGYSLESICNVLSVEVADEDEEFAASIPDDDTIGGFTESIISSTENVSLLLELIDEYDFNVKWPTVKLFTAMLLSRCRQVQEAVLAQPMGISKLMELLSERREVIRNDALLLLYQLTRGNSHIQRNVAFLNAYELLLDIIVDEGLSDGGIVVEDCLVLLLNLLKGNPSNQTLYIESGFVQPLVGFFKFISDEETSANMTWSAQKVANVQLMLQLIRTLVHPGNPQQVVASCQKSMNKRGLLQLLSSALMASGVPPDVLSEFINTVSEILRGNQENQNYFASVMAPSDPPRPAIVVLLMSMVNEKQSFVLRCAVLYCIECFLYRNDLGRSQITQTLLPSSSDADSTSVSAGQLLCLGLFSGDSLSSWFAAVALLHAVLDSTKLKEQLLKVQLQTAIGQPPTSLLQKCCEILLQSTATFQMRVGVLQLLGVWLHECPTAVSHFLSSPSNVSFLISQVTGSESHDDEIAVQGLSAFLLGVCFLYNNDKTASYTRQALRQVIDGRVGAERFADRLTQLSKLDGYVKAAKRPQVVGARPDDIMFDYQFTHVFKSAEYEISRKLQAPLGKGADDSPGSLKHDSTNFEQHDAVVNEYKELIRDMDTQLNSAKSDLARFQQEAESSQKEVLQLRIQCAELRDQNTLLRAAQNASLHDASSVSSSDQAVVEKASSATQSTEIGALSSVDSAKWEETVNSLQAEIIERDAEISRLQTLTASNDSAPPSNHLTDSHLPNGPISAGEASNITSSQANDAVLEQLRNDLHGKQMEISELLSKSKEDELIIAELKNKASAYTAEIDNLKKENESCRTSLADLKEHLTENDNTTHNVTDKLATVEKEQEDLLVLLADQDAKLKLYKERLRRLGQQVSDDEDDDLGEMLDE